MIREGEHNVTLKFLAESPSKLAISNFTEGMYSQAVGKRPIRFSIEKIPSSIQETLRIFSLMCSADAPLTRMWNQCRSKEAIFGIIITI